MTTRPAASSEGSACRCGHPREQHAWHTDSLGQCIWKHCPCRVYVEAPRIPPPPPQAESSEAGELAKAIAAAMCRLVDHVWNVTDEGDNEMVGELDDALRAALPYVESAARRPSEVASLHPPAAPASAVDVEALLVAVRAVVPTRWHWMLVRVEAAIRAYFATPPARSTEGADASATSPAQGEPSPTRVTHFDSELGDALSREYARLFVSPEGLRAVVNTNDMQSFCPICGLAGPEAKRHAGNCPVPMLREYVTSLAAALGSAAGKEE